MNNNEKNLNIDMNIKSKTPFEYIINNYLSQFQIQDIINFFFFFTENEKKLKRKEENINENKDSPYDILSFINKNNQVSIRAFLEVLRENYGDECIIKELYKKLIDESPNNNSFLQNIEINKEIINIDTKNISTKRLSRKIARKKHYNTLINKIKVKNNWIIPLESTLSNISLKEDEIQIKIVGYLQKSKFNHIFLFYPIFKKNNYISDKLNEIIQDNNKILFVCEMYQNQNQNNRCNSYGIFDLSKMNFSLGAKHSKRKNQHPHSKKLKIKDKSTKEDELIETIIQFKKMSINGALIIKENF